MYPVRMMISGGVCFLLYPLLSSWNSGWDSVFRWHCTDTSFLRAPSLFLSLGPTRRAKRRTRGGTVRRMSGEKREDGAFCRTTAVVHEWTRFHSETSMNERGGRMPRNGRECGSKGLIARITWIARARLDKVHLNRMELSDWYRASPWNG